jgi:hypothetical protein
LSDAVLIRLAGVTAHYRDPRYNTGKIARGNNLAIRTLHCPPPCTLHAMLCAARGGWVDPDNLVVGWRMDFDSLSSDFQRCQLPQRGQYNFSTGAQKVEISPRIREFLAFPRLTIFAISGVDPEWFRRPANPLCLGRSEDLVVEKRIIRNISWQRIQEATIMHQCLPFFTGFGILYPAPLYFERNRRPIDLSPKTDARIEQPVRDQSDASRLAQVTDTGESFFLWDYSRVTGQK